MDHVTFEDAVMSEEIFGPVMPVLTFSRMSEATDKINSMAHPLALYIFTSSKRLQMKSFPILVSVVAVSTIPLSILPQQKWALAASAKVAWALIMAKPDLIPFPIIKASLIKKPVLICL